MRHSARPQLVMIAVLLALLVGCAAPPSSRETATEIAFVNVDVIPMDRERILHDHTVVVLDGRIIELGPAEEVKVPERAKTIDGRGRFLIPGLADMHVHTWYEQELVLFVANGVTAIRNMSGRPFHIEWRERINNGELFGPTIYTTSPLLDGNPPTWPGTVVVETAEEAKNAVERLKLAGYDFLKVYDSLSREAYDALMTAAEDERIRVVGHVPHAVGLDQVLADDQHSIEHLTGYGLALLPEDVSTDDWKPLDFYLKVREHVDETKFSAVAEKTRAAGAWNCPTLTAALSGIAPEEQVRERPEMKYVRPEDLTSWKRMRRSLTPEYVTSVQRAYSVQKKLVKALHEAGARLLVGTDSRNAFPAHGFALQDELLAFVDAGLTPYDALSCATREASAFLNQLGEFGTITLGSRADLVLLDANPLEDIANISRRTGVMVRGAWYREDQLQGRLEAIAKAYTAPDYVPTELSDHPIMTDPETDAGNK